MTIEIDIDNSIDIERMSDQANCYGLIITKLDRNGVNGYPTAILKGPADGCRKFVKRYFYDDVEAYVVEA